MATVSPPDISIIIPVLNDAKALELALSSTRDCIGVERIVVDGGSSDRSAEVARSQGVKTLHSPPGRARQMNAGAEVAGGTFLVFLHADTRLPEEFDTRADPLFTNWNYIFILEPKGHFARHEFAVDPVLTEEDWGKYCAGLERSKQNVLALLPDHYELLSAIRGTAPDTFTQASSKAAPALTD